MFDLNYIAANTGATWSHKADVFTTEAVTANASGVIDLKYAPVPVQAGGKAYVMYRKASDANAEYEKVEYTGTPAKKVTLPAAYYSTDVCIMYRYTNDFADTITISSQFIPETVHAILTTALYAGDSCNIGVSTNKIGEIVIDIPRLQLSGSNDLSMTAAGASQSSLTGNALSSGCSGCSGKPSYATISRILFDQNKDTFAGVVIEDGNFTLSDANPSKELYCYATFNGSIPHKVDNTKVVWSSNQTSSATVSGNVVTKVASGSATITATVTLDGVTKTASVTCTVE